MTGGRGVRGNREVSPLFLLGGGGGGRIATPLEATSQEGDSWGKHGFPHESEPKASDGHVLSQNARSRSLKGSPSSCGLCADGNTADSAPNRSTRTSQTAWKMTPPRSAAARGAEAQSPRTTSVRITPSTSKGISASAGLRSAHDERAASRSRPASTWSRGEKPKLRRKRAW